MNNSHIVGDAFDCIFREDIINTIKNMKSKELNKHKIKI